MKFRVVANPNSSEETGEFGSDEVVRIEIYSNGHLHIDTTDDSTRTYLEDEWLRVELINDSE